MSGLAAVYHLDGRAADPAVLRRMLAAIGHRGPDRAGEWCRGCLAFGHVSLHTTPESVAERQPVANEAQSVVVVFDGRLDNRDELRDRLAADRIHLRDDSDAELVLRAYERHGADTFALLLGDFAIAVWDGACGRVVCARDPLGIRPLYYAIQDAAFLCGSEIKQFFASGAVRPAPNPGFMGELLSYRPTSVAETLYEGVRRLPPGHVMTVGKSGAALTRYFEIDAAREIHYKRDDEYAEHFSEVFERAVAARLRAVGPVSVFLSGGVDSTAIAGMAQRISKPSIALMSLGSAHPEADERQYIDDACRMWNMSATTIAVDSHAPSCVADTVMDELDFPDAPNTVPWAVLLARAGSIGGRVALWGHGGDEWLTGDASHCADMLAACDVRGALRQLRRDVAVSNEWGGGGVSVRDVIRWLVIPLLPWPVKRCLRPFAGAGVPRWIDRRFARRIDLPSRFRTSRARARFPTAAQCAIAAQLDDGWAVWERELMDRFSAKWSIESRFAFHDRRIVEFALAIPEWQRWRGDQTKYVVRQACAALMPESIRARRTKADFSYLFVDMLAREPVDETFAALELAADGYVDAREVRRTYDRFLAGSRRDLDTVWLVYTMERWYRTMFRGGLRDRARDATARDAAGRRAAHERHTATTQAVRAARAR